MEDETINVQISREAALGVVRDRLRTRMEDPSYEDAHQYLRENFEYGDALADFLQGQHDQWVIVKHPSIQ